jgi:hypothetical protein
LARKWLNSGLREEIIIILGYIREDIMNNNSKNEQLDITIRFIEETKKGVYADISNSSTVLTPRSDEPTIYANEPEESAFLSFCN